jgi:acetyl esterase
MTAAAVSSLAGDRAIAGPGGILSLRVLTPDDVQGVYLHFHGGGWVSGSSRLQDPALEELAARSRAAVVSVEYRLAPAHPYPAAPDDCEAAAVWLAERCSSEFGTDRLCIGGESAGAQLAVVTLLRLRDRHGFTGFGAANLVSGVFDLGLTPSARTWSTEPGLDWCIDQFVSRERRRDADVSPLYADLGGLPDALLTVGTLDPLVDDSRLLWERWAAAGGRAALALYQGGAHSFHTAPTALARRAKSRIHDFLSAHL